VHRGNSAVWPGNTSQGISRAVKQSAKLIEVDLRRNSSGSLFLFHDGKLNEKNFSGPKTWLGRKAESLNDTELGNLCFPPDRRQCAIRFEKALQLIWGKQTIFLLDLKNVSPAMIDQIVSEANKSEQLNQIILQIPSIDLIEPVRTKYPNVAILARCFDEAQVITALKFNPEIIQVDEDWISPSLTKTIHNAKSKILVKTVDGDESAKHHRTLFESGFDIILSDKISD